MRELKPRFYIISAERYSETDAINEQRTANLESTLERLTLDFKRVSGFFEGHRETSFLVLDKPHGWKAWDGCDVFDCVQGLAWAFDQDSFLERHPDGAAELHETDIGAEGRTHATFIGEWQEGTPRVGEHYTRDDETGVCYVCR